MANELKQLAQMIKNSADTRYAKKGEVSESSDDQSGCTASLPMEKIEELITTKIATIQANLNASVPAQIVYQHSGVKPTYSNGNSYVRDTNHCVTTNSGFFIGIAKKANKYLVHNGNSIKIYNLSDNSLIKSLSIDSIEHGNDKYIGFSEDGTKYYYRDKNVIRMVTFSSDYSSINNATLYRKDSNKFTPVLDKVNLSLFTGDPNSRKRFYILTYSQGAYISKAYSLISSVNEIVQAVAPINPDYSEIVHYDEETKKLFYTTKTNDTTYTEQYELKYIGALPNQMQVSICGTHLYMLIGTALMRYTIKRENGTVSLVDETRYGLPNNQNIKSFDVSLDNQSLIMHSISGYAGLLDINQSIFLDANSLDPFGDGSLKHFYKLDGDVKDSVGDAHGTVNGTGTFVNAKHGKGFRNISTADNNNITIPNHDITPNNLGTISAWVSDIWTSNDNNSRILSIGKGGINNKYAWCVFNISTDGIETCYGATNGTVYKGKVFSKTALVSGLNHIVATYPLNYNSREFKLYINGVEITDFTIHPQEGSGQPHSTFGGQAMIAGYSGQNNHSATGIVDHIQIFDRILTQDEITKLYKAEVQ
jgi:hypothetical protein